MAPPIDLLRISSLIDSIQAPAPGVERQGAGAEFRDALSDAVRRVENYRAGADGAVERFLAGEGEDLHSVALATQRAELAFELFLQVRNKVVQAYQEVMRMQV